MIVPLAAVCRLIAEVGLASHRPRAAQTLPGTTTFLVLMSISSPRLLRTSIISGLGDDAHERNTRRGTGPYSRDKGRRRPLGDSDEPTMRIRASS
ncbi:hypothetical protein OBBRIDRAFT_138790 [Obba rivulosa]|uniref:Uncharacterized protein n=1 Tax=Obba rivulosa TaxID=1052685 RepID=A0A8E2AQR7_9APHY|nr:hypothetical protein OBBRIDRAFT_138790 [Obba rivulosa]